MTRKQKVYSYELKKEVVEKYLAGHASRDLAKEYHISDSRVVTRWAYKVREGGYEALKDKRGIRKVDLQKQKEEETKNEIIERQALQIEYLKKLLELERM